MIYKPVQTPCCWQDLKTKKKVMDGWHMLAAITNQTAVKPWFLLSQIRYQDHSFPIFSGLRAPSSTFTTSHSWKITYQTNSINIEGSKVYNIHKFPIVKHIITSLYHKHTTYSQHHLGIVRARPCNPSSSSDNLQIQDMRRENWPLVR